MTKKRIFLGASVLTVILLVAGAIGLSDSSKMKFPPTITASPEVTLKNPEPDITADSKIKLKATKPVVKTAPAPAVVPAPIAETRDGYTPLLPIQEQAPYSIVPEPTPAQRPIYRLPPPVSTVTPSLPVPVRPPSIPLPSPLLPPALTEPLRPITGPVSGILDPIIPRLLK